MLWLLYHVINFHWQMFFQMVRIFMNLTNLSFYLFFNLTLILIKLFLIPFEIISMHQREDPPNTLCISFFAVFPGFLMPLKLLVLSKTFLWTYNWFLIILLILPNQSVKRLKAYAKANQTTLY